MPSTQDYGDRVDRLLGSACPKCGSLNAHRCHRWSLIDYLISLAGVWPYRCKNCHGTFRASRRLRKWGEERPWSLPASSWRVPEQE